jgi:hypothetical protein
MSRETNPEVTPENSKKWSPNYGSGGSMKVEIKPFDEKINFGLWQRRMRGVLIQQRLQVALEDRPEGMSDPRVVRYRSTGNLHHRDVYHR